MKAWSLVEKLAHRLCEGSSRAQVDGGREARVSLDTLTISLDALRTHGGGVGRARITLCEGALAPE